jgi:hypothetical protein
VSLAPQVSCVATGLRSGSPTTLQPHRQFAVLNTDNSAAGHAGAAGWYNVLRTQNEAAIRRASEGAATILRAPGILLRVRRRGVD